MEHDLDEAIYSEHLRASQEIQNEEAVLSQEEETELDTLLGEHMGLSFGTR